MARQGQANLAVTDALPSFEERKMRLDEGRLALDSSPAKVWGPIVIPALLAAVVPLTTLIVTQSAERKDHFAQTEESQRQKTEAAAQRAVDNGRAVIGLYFDKVGDLRSKPTMSSREQASYLSDLLLLEKVSGNAEIALLFRQRWAELNRVNPATVAQTGAAEPVVNADAVDVISRPASGRYAAGQFLAFPQTPKGRQEQDASLLADALAGMGFNVQATQRIDPGRSPEGNQVRFYRPDHQQFATAIARQLAAKLCAPVAAVRVGGGRLPNGVMEFWLGQGARAKFAPPC